MTDPTISPHEPPALLNRLDYHASRTPQFKELADAATRIRELEAQLADREQEAEARYNQWYDAYTNLRTVGAENATLRDALRKIADDGRNCMDHCRHQARRALSTAECEERE